MHPVKAIIGVFVSAFLLVALAPFNSANSADRVWKLGWLDLSPSSRLISLNSFLEGMHNLGYAENRDFLIEARFADTDRSRLPDLAKELVDDNVDMIVTVGTPTTVAAKHATSTIPIVMTGAGNLSLFASVAHPGGNVTGMLNTPGPEFWKKGLQLLKEAVPRITRVGILRAPSPSDDHLPPVSGLTLTEYDIGFVRNVEDLHTIFSQIQAAHMDALYIFPEFVVDKYQNEIGDFLKSSHLPAMTWAKALIENDGALLFYSIDFQALRRRAATYVDKIIKGAKPGEIPVEYPSKFEFIVNLKTAQDLNLTIPQNVIAFADRVIE